MKAIYPTKMLLCVFFGCCIYKVLPAQDTATALTALQSGSAMYKQHHFVQAADYFEISLQNVPTAYGYFFLGASYYNLSRYSEAKKNVTRALNLKLTPPLSQQRQQEAKIILKKIDSIAMNPAPPLLAQEKSEQGVSSDPLISPPDAGAKNPFDSENPLLQKTMKYNYVSHAVIQCSQNNFTVRSTYNCDLENNGAFDNADFWWNTTDYVGILTPRNGAKFFLMWSCYDCYDTLTKQDLIDYEARELMTTDNIPLQQLKRGNLIAYITRNNLYGVMKIENIVYNGLDPNLLVSFRTYK